MIRFLLKIGVCMKSKIFKIIFILSFIPYLYILYLILFGRYTLNGIELKGIERLLKNIVSTLQYEIFTPIIPTCLTFQMCYIFRRKSKIMFICSFIPCIFILVLGLQYAFFGGRFIGDTLYYGFEGFEIGIFCGFIDYFMVFPILPICLIFQIWYIIIKLKNRKNSLKENSV